MKWINAITVFAIATLALAGQSFAQSKRAQATVPFDFTVGEKMLPAGTYTIKFESGSHVVMIKHHDKPIVMLSLVDQDGNRSPGGGRWVFNRYGTRYFLSEILCDDADMNVRIPASKGEKRVQLDFARLGTASQTLVAAR
jgi:hypothetical protein